MGSVLAPSILSADFARLGAEVKEAEAGGAALIHVDVMDGRFVPNISIGPAVTRAVRDVTQLPLDCHLMVEEPTRWIDRFAEAGADMITVHVEAERHLHRALAAIRERGLKAGVALNPGTPLAALGAVLGDVDHVLVMTVDPGFGGQKLIPAALAKVGELRAWLARERIDVRIEIDGGVELETIDTAVALGADIIVAGSAVFGRGDVRVATQALVRRLAQLAERGQRC